MHQDFCNTVSTIGRMLTLNRYKLISFHLYIYIFIYFFHFLHFYIKIGNFLCASFPLKIMLDPLPDHHL